MTGGRITEEQLRHAERLVTGDVEGTAAWLRQTSKHVMLLVAEVRYHRETLQQLTERGLMAGEDFATIMLRRHPERFGADDDDQHDFRAGAGGTERCTACGCWKTADTIGRHCPGEVP